jgi:hypothetical protein
MVMSKNLTRFPVPVCLCIFLVCATNGLCHACATLINLDLLLTASIWKTCCMCTKLHKKQTTGTFLLSIKKISESHNINRAHTIREKIVYISKWKFCALVLILSKKEIWPKNWCALHMPVPPSVLFILPST